MLDSFTVLYHHFRSCSLKFIFLFIPHLRGSWLLETTRPWLLIQQTFTLDLQAIYPIEAVWYGNAVQGVTIDLQETTHKLEEKSGNGTNSRTAIAPQFQERVIQALVFFLGGGPSALLPSSLSLTRIRDRFASLSLHESIS